MSVFTEIWNVLKPVIETYTEGKTIPRFLVNAGIKQATKLTPNLSKSILYGKDNKAEHVSSIIKLLTGQDDLSKQFRKVFSDFCKIWNLKTSLLIEEKAKIAEELNKQDEVKEDTVKKLNEGQANAKVLDLIKEVSDATLNKPGTPQAESGSDAGSETTG